MELPTQRKRLNLYGRLPPYPTSSEFLPAESSRTGNLRGYLATRQYRPSVSDLVMFLNFITFINLHLDPDYVYPSSHRLNLSGTLLLSHHSRFARIGCQPSTSERAVPLVGLHSPR